MEEVLVGLKNIALFIGSGVKTVKKLIMQYQLPAYRYSDGIYRASKKKLVEWFESHPETMRKER